MSLAYLREAVEQDDFEKLIRYVRMHFGDGDDALGRKEIDKAWVEALKLLIVQPTTNPELPIANRELPTTNQELVHELVESQSPETLAHLFFYLHFYLVKRSGEWIHDGEL
jgi:hypothetical protein